MQLAKSELNFPEGPWISLLEKAYLLLDKIAGDKFTLPCWSLGGGTVLIFRYGHLLSKDIDIFIPDRQFLAYVNPRTGVRGEDLTSDYKDSASHPPNNH